MASLMEEIADALARDVIRAMEETGDENLVTEVSRAIGSSSTTTQEAFMTAVRVRMSEQRARRLLAEKVGAEWPLAPGATGASMPAVTLAAQAPAPIQAPAPQRLAPEPPPAPQPARVEERAPKPVGSPEPAAAPAEEPLQVGVADPKDPLHVRPKIPAAPSPSPKPALAPSAPPSLEAALALATSLPRKVVPPVEPTTPVVNPYADIEMPDGDWG